jgi:hypothetical protein
VIHGAQVQRREEPEGSRTMQQQQRALRACTEEPSLQSIATATPIVPIVPHPLESVRFRADGRRGAIARAHRHAWRSAVHRCSQRVCCACPERKTPDDDAIRQSTRLAGKHPTWREPGRTTDDRRRRVSEQATALGATPTCCIRTRTGIDESTNAISCAWPSMQTPGSTARNTHDNTAHGRRRRSAQTEAKRCGKAVAGLCFRPPSVWLRRNLANFARIARIGIAVRESHGLR